MSKRIQRKRVKGYKMPADAVYVGRPTKWGNPFNWKDADGDLIPPNVAKGYAKELFSNWLKGGYFAWSDKENLEDRRQWILEHISDLRGKDLACWCSPDEPCHADVLLRLANGKGN